MGATTKQTETGSQCIKPDPPNTFSKDKSYLQLISIAQMSRLVCCCHTFRPLADATILHVLTATRKTVPRAAGMNHPRHGQSSTQKDQTESCADDDINPESFETVPVGPLHAKKRTKQKASNHHIESHESYSFQIFLQKKSGPIYLGRFG